MRILFVCLGNICRSPSAEAVLRAMRPDWTVESAGVGGWHVDNPPDRRAIAEGAKRGYDLSAIRARQINASDFFEFDLILAMDKVNLADMTAMKPKESTAEIRLFLENRAVPDPYYEGGFDHMFDLIEAGCAAIVARYAESES